jgi:hypothetical protein
MVGDKRLAGGKRRSIMDDKGFVANEQTFVRGL